MTAPDPWKPIGDAARDVVAQLEQKQRKQFERDCRDDHVLLATQKQNGEREHAGVQ